MQGEVAEDLLSLSLSIGGGGGSKKRKRRDYDHHNCDKNLTMAVLRARDRMLQLDCITTCGFEDAERGLQLIRILLLCAAAADRSDMVSASSTLLELYRCVSLSGDPIQRVAAYFADGFLARLLTPASPFYAAVIANPSSADEFSAFTDLYRASPYYQFAHFTANQAIIEAFEAEEHSNGGILHVIDFDVSYGFQWPSLIQSLSDKATSKNPIGLRITGFGRNEAELRETETRLSAFAGGCCDLSFEFQGKLRGEATSLKDLNLQTNATVVVNLVFCLQKLKWFAEISSMLMEIQSLNPSLVVLVEKEEGCTSDTTGFLSRFMDTLHYFAAMFDSLDDCLPAESKGRLRIEKNHLGKEIRNAVMMEDDKELMKCRGLETWKEVMEMNGFEGVRMSSRSVSQAKLLLKIKSHCSAMEEHGGSSGFRFSERDNGRAISLGWRERILITASAWKCFCTSEI